MNGNVSYLIYPIVSIVYIYSMSGLLKIFLGDPKTPPAKYSKILYLLYYISVTYSFIKFGPGNETMLVNILFLLLSTTLFKTNIKHRLLSIVFVIAFMTGLDMLVSTCFCLKMNLSYEILREGPYLLFQVITLNLAMLLSSKIIPPSVSAIRHIPSDSPKAPEYWLVIILTPILSVIIIYNMYQILMQGESAYALNAVFTIMCMMIINVLIYVIYERQMKFHEREILLTLQSKQYEHLRESENRLNEEIHNLKNRLIGVLDYLSSSKEDDVTKAKTQLADFLGEISEITFTRVWCGINEINSILNYKSTKASETEVQLDAMIEVSPEHRTDYHRIALIIGNALDNAIEACWEVKDRSKIVKLRLCEQMGNLYLHVENPYHGIIRCHNGIPVSTRGIGHGFGFKTIQRIVQEQGDYMSVDLSENIFKLKIIFYSENIENLSLG